jgi:molybdate transport system substrate-binding protein
MSTQLKIRTPLAYFGVLLTLLFAACSPAPATPGSAGAGGSGAPSVSTPAAPAVSPAATATTKPALNGELTVFAASSLTDAFNEIATQFQSANPGVKVTYNYNGTPTLRTQLEQGAHADVFASANTDQMDMAVRSGLVITGTQKNFAQNKLTIVVPKDNPAKITGPVDLAKPGIKLVLAQKDVPVGGYARDAFTKMSTNATYGADFSDRTLKNLVSEESNVKQVLSKVQLGEADAAVVYTTDITPDAAASVMQIAIPDQFNVIATYPFARLKDAKQPELADAFVSYVLGTQGQATLKKWGFLPPA